MTTLENSYCVPKGEEWDIFRTPYIKLLLKLMTDETLPIPHTKDRSHDPRGNR